MKILNFGSLNIDYVYKVDHMTAKGETQLARSRAVFTGGKGLNQSVAMGRAGLPVFHAGNIGIGGEFLLDELRRSNVNIDDVRVLKDTPTGHTVIQNDQDGDNCILLFGGANQAVTQEQVDEVISQFGKGDVLVLQNEINELSCIMKKAHEAGMKIVLNPSPMNERIAELPLEYVDLFMLNEIEAEQLTHLVSGGTKGAGETPLRVGEKTDGSVSRDGEEKGDGDLAERLIGGIRDRFADASVVLTLGSEGSVYSDGKETVRQGIYKVKTVDTTAAGDTFTGYFLAGILGGKTPAEALDLAAKASSIAVSRPGAAPSIPTMAEVLANAN